MTPKPEMPKPDKYDESPMIMHWKQLDRAITVALNLCLVNLPSTGMGNNYDEEVRASCRDALRALSSFGDALRSAFPPPAEDAISLLHSWADKGWVSPYHSDDDECIRLAAEIESFAQSRVEPWREAAKAMCDSYKQGYDCGDWGNWDLEQDMPYVNLRALLSDSPAKEAR